jgi:competence protein ComEC
MKKIRNNYLKIFALMIITVLSAAGCSPYKQAAAMQADIKGQEAGVSKDVKTSAENSLMVHFLDVGQADSILITSQGAAMLVDAGNNEDEEFVLGYLKEQGITRLDYVIGTHPHEDHIGSLDAVIRNFEIGKVILPEKVHTSKTFQDVLSAIEEKELQITKPVVADKYSLGDANFTIIGPAKDYGNDLNNWSVGIKLTDGDNDFIMCGDAEIEAEYDMTETGIDLQAEVLKVCHHGSRTSTSEAFLKAVNPKYAVISVGKDNTYGHPNNEILDRLENRSIEVYRTDESGTITIVSDGKTLTWNTESSIQAQEEEDESAELQEKNTAFPSNEQVMVYGTNAGKKYHRKGCSYLNKSNIEMTLKEVRSKGLEPCLKCKPPE